LEATSSPPGGEISIDYEDGSLVLDMSSGDLSTLRAMLNSYLGLVSTAVKTAKK
jgi:tRNA threonylcarbamoyladenosine modification (KEOPS) complex  Pcc1 subunit